MYLQVALDGVENIDTVVSFGLEERLYKDYKKHLKKPDRYTNAVVSLVCFHQFVACIYSGTIFHSKTTTGLLSQ